MELTFNQTLIFLPMLLVVAVSIVAFARLIYMRIKTISGRHVPMRYYVAFQGGAEPEETAIAARHYLNMFESPVLFYAACLSACVLEAVTPAIYYSAWAYAVLRTGQSFIHLTYNNVKHRAYVFMAAWAAVIVMWAQIAGAVFAKVG